MRPGAELPVAEDRPSSFDIAAWTAKSRAACGLPPKIEDQAVIARLVVLAGIGEGGGRGAP
jgi:hypothetical protein